MVYITQGSVKGNAVRQIKRGAERELVFGTFTLVFSRVTGYDVGRSGMHVHFQPGVRRRKPPVVGNTPGSGSFGAVAVAGQAVGLLINDIGWKWIDDVQTVNPAVVVVKGSKVEGKLFEWHIAVAD